ncbi:hypothetical protein PILCRDRAFT_15308 [Piloderma croceum F 1598]|uniref:Uncharacterized protein n=1 Tax=Piloderma croceum (strain F 1598) TaxID=765440 RepID=A0A0C3EZI0_PILCF|nr:hypothetical protein PILCRDRAFT_15308 [Piloderma croceum F 1598]
MLQVPGREPPHPIFTGTSSPSLQLAMHICIYMYYEGKVGSRLTLSSQIPSPRLWDL